jgi:hypothetical protein
MDEQEKLKEARDTLRKIEEQMKEFEQVIELLKGQIDRIEEAAKNNGGLGREDR